MLNHVARIFPVRSLPFRCSLPDPPWPGLDLSRTEGRERSRAGHGGKFPSLRNGRECTVLCRLLRA